MSILLATLNSQYVHTSLSVRTLRQSYLQEGLDKLRDLIVKEYTINEDWRQIADDIYSLRPEVVLFSCYIWNMKEIDRIARRLKQWRDDLTILVGGPEVGFTPESSMQRYPWIDGIFCGEGEVSFPSVMKTYFQYGFFLATVGFVVKQENGNCSGEVQPTYVPDLDQITFPYTSQELERLKAQILYYESSRGCPYSCQYCLSSVHQPVRFLPLQRVLRELDQFMEAGVRQVKFVDRTFNANRKRAREIWQYLIEKNSQTNFHFELAADLLEQEDIELLRKVPKGMFQFEIGVQSTDPRTLALVQRVTDFEKIKLMVLQIRDLNTIHLHLDLIAGLPGEDFQSFGRSFDDVYGLGSDMLQLGFLKVLPGTAMEANAKEYGLIYDQEPPYEILATSQLKPEELLRIHHIEELFERYSNSGKFPFTMEGLIDLYTGAYACYEAMARMYQNQGWLFHPVREGIHWQRLWHFIERSPADQHQKQRLLQRMKLDFYLKFADEDFPIKELEDKAKPDEKRLIQNTLRDWAGPQSKKKWKIRGVWLEGKKHQLLMPLVHPEDTVLISKVLYVFLYDLEKHRECVDWFEIEDISKTKFPLEGV